jgi:hypothetical protein
LAATTVLSLAQSCLGLTFNPAAGEVICDRPLLPDFVDDIRLRQIRVPGGQLDIPLARARKEGAVHVMDRTGSVRAVTRSRRPRARRWEGFRTFR